MERALVFHGEKPQEVGTWRMCWGCISRFLINVLQNAFVKLFDFATQMAMLRQLLLSGSPVRLSYGFAVFLAVNALSCVANIPTDRFSAPTEVFIAAANQRLGRFECKKTGRRLVTCDHSHGVRT